MKNKHLILILVIMAAVLASLFLGTRSISHYNFAKLEHEDMTRNVELANNVLLDELQQLSITAGDYAGWDDAYAFVRNGNPAFVKANLEFVTFEKLRLNLLIYLNQSGKIIHAQAYDFHNNRELPVTQTLLTHFQPGKPLLSHTSPESKLSGILQLPEGLMLIASRPVLTSSYHGPIMGSLVIGRYLDNEETKRLSNLTKLKLQIITEKHEPLGKALKDAQQQLSGKNAVYVKPLNEERIIGITQLNDIYGKTAGLLQVEEPRHIHQISKDAAGHFYLLYCTTTVIFCVILLLLARQLVLASRLEIKKEDALRNSEANYRSLFEIMIQGVFRQKADGVLIDANPAALKIFGLTIEEFLGRTSITPTWDVVLEDGTPLPGEKHPSMLALANGKPVRGVVLGVFNFKLQKRFWVEVNAIPEFLNGEEKPFQVLVTMHDVTDRKRDEEALRSASIYTRTLIEASPDPLVTISADGKITDVNEASVKVTGIPREQLVGTDFSAYFTDPEKAREGYLRVFSDSVVHDYPLAIRHVSGTITEVLYNASIYRDEHGNVKGVFAAARDVTDRNRVADALKKALDELETRVAERTADLEQANEQMKKVSFELVWAEERERERIAGELHDQVGQSLLLAKMKLDALMDKVSTDPLASYAEEASSLLATSIQDIRSLTFRMRPPILDTASIETALEWLCSSISNDYSIQIDFTHDCLPRQLPAEMRYSLYQAVRELLLNVVKHAKTDKAQLTVKTEDQALVVQVKDNGIGFNHADMGLKSLSNGGYGLYNVQHRMKQLGGSFAVESPPGAGTSVTLLVPFLKNDEGGDQNADNHTAR